MGGMNKVFERLERARSALGAPRRAPGLKITGEVINSLGAWIPGVAFVGGAIRLAGNVLDPPALLSDLKKETESIKQHMDGRSEKFVASLAVELNQVENNLRKEIDLHFQRVQEDIQNNFDAMSNELKKHDDALQDIKALVAETLGVALEQRYLDGIEKVNGTFESFLHGSTNIRGEVDKMRFYIAEFQGLATASFEVPKIGDYLAKLVSLKGPEIARQTLAYILIVRAKYLQLILIYYSHNEDEDRVNTEFNLFNNFFQDLETVAQRIFGEELDKQFFSKMPKTSFSFSNQINQTSC